MKLNQIQRYNIFFNYFVRTVIFLIILILYDFSLFNYLVFSEIKS